MNSERERRIREKAYSLWEQHGRPEGNHQAHWHEAERAVDEEDQGAATPKRPAKAVKTAKTLSEDAAESAVAPRGARKQPGGASETEAVATKQETDAAKPKRRGAGA